jgi:hypothetical protein
MVAMGGSPRPPFVGFVEWSTAPLEKSIEDTLDEGQPTKEVTQKGDACGVFVVQDFEGVASRGTSSTVPGL